MKVAGNTVPDTDPELQRLLAESRERQVAALAGPERMVELATSLALLVVAVLMVVLLPGGRSLDVPVAVGLVLMYALAARVEFHTGAGWTVPTQLVLVPMLFALPVDAVPLFVIAGTVLGRLPEHVRGDVRLSRAIIGIGDSWHSVGPALVLVAAGPAAPSWGDWPVYVIALAAQLWVDLAVSAIRGGLGLGLSLSSHLDELRSVYLVDALLSPVGLVLAFGMTSWQWAFLLALPLLALIRIFAREREARIENAQVLSSAYRGTAHLMAELLSTSHEYTGQHSRSVVVLAHQVGQRLGLDDAKLRDIEFGALLHDIGKMAVPNEIINKPGRLSDEELELMRTHTLEGEQMLDRIGGVLGEVGHVVRSHHEFWNGLGYPDGLKGEAIPIAARVIAACDAFNAMTTHRSYRPAMSLPEAIEELRLNAGSQFDPGVVDALVAIVETWDGEAPDVTPEAIAGARERRFETAA